MQNSEKNAAIMLELFRGREARYAKRWHSAKGDRAGYSVVCAQEWGPGCEKRKGGCHLCASPQFAALTAHAILRHLSIAGESDAGTIAIYPITDENKAWLGALHVAGERWAAHVTLLRTLFANAGTPVAVERCPDGARIWLFLSSHMPAADVREYLAAIVTAARRADHTIPFTLYDSIYPTQRTCVSAMYGFDDTLPLPLSPVHVTQGYGVFLNDSLQPLSNQAAYIASLLNARVQPEKVRTARKTLPEGEFGLLWPKDGVVCYPGMQHDDMLAVTSHLIACQHVLRDPAVRYPSSITVTRSNMLRVPKAGFSEPMLDALQRLAAYRDAQCMEAEDARRKASAYPRVICEAKEDGDAIYLPRGCENALVRMLSPHIRVTFVDARTTGTPITADFKGELRPEQKPALAVTEAYDNGIINLPTAFGKTVIAAGIIAQKKVNTLILVNTQALLGQWEKALENFLCIDGPRTMPPGRKRMPKEIIGKLGGGKSTLQGVVDVAILQSIAVKDEQAKQALLAPYGMIIMDECHHAPATTFTDILHLAPAKYLYGLTATAMRSDGRQNSMYMACGPIRYKVPASEQAKKRGFTHHVVPHFLDTPYNKEACATYNDTLAVLAQNAVRTEIIAADAISCVHHGRSPIILTERVEHAESISAALRSKNACEHIITLTGSGTAAAKRDKLEALKAVPPEASLIVIATGRYVGEGFDSPRLDTLLLAMPVAWKGLLEQYAGRLHRICDGKTSVQIHDYIDAQFPVLRRMFNKRLAGYQNIGYSVGYAEGDAGTAISATGMIYSGSEADDRIAADLAIASRITAFYPRMDAGADVACLELFAPALANGAVVSLHTPHAKSYFMREKIAMAQKMHLHIQQGGVFIYPHIHIMQAALILDEKTVWYGGYDYLAPEHAGYSFRLECKTFALQCLTEN